MCWRSLQCLIKTDIQVFHCEILPRRCGATGRDPSRPQIRPQQLADGGWRGKSSLKRRGAPQWGWVGRAGGLKRHLESREWTSSAGNQTYRRYTHVHASRTGGSIMGRPMKQLSLTSRWPGLEVSWGIIISSFLREICKANIFGFRHN